MEWPFIADWVRHLAKEGVDRLLLGIDPLGTQGFVWTKKPHPEIFWPEMTDANIAAAWEEAIHSVGSTMQISQEELPGGATELLRLRHQENWLREVHRRATREEADWVLNFDVDEFPESTERDTVREVLEATPEEIAIVYLLQYLFDSRWDITRGRRPQTRPEITACHAEPVMLPKYAFRPGRVRRLHLHHAIARPGFLALTADPGSLFFKHYRGIEKAWDRELATITRLDARWEWQRNLEA